jgi:hypothetical protein
LIQYVHEQSGGRSAARMSRLQLKTQVALVFDVSDKTESLQVIRLAK